MHKLIDAVTQAIMDGSLTLDNAVEFTIAHANGAWGVIAKLAHAIG